jgi:hypothetical protein
MLMLAAHVSPCRVADLVTNAACAGCAIVSFACCWYVRLATAVTLHYYSDVLKAYNAQLLASLQLTAEPRATWILHVLHSV